MKAITPAEVKSKATRDGIRDAIIIQAYNQLIAENFGKAGPPNRATFTQAKLLGRIKALGCQLDPTTLIMGNYLRQEVEFNGSGWVVKPDTCFYTSINGAQQISFEAI
jgi:hypothetical protein